MHPTDKLTLDNGAIIFLTPCPGTKTLSLKDTLAQFAEQGVKGLVSLTPQSEMKKLQVENMPEICHLLNIEWFYAPVDDHQAPTEAFEQEWSKSKVKIHKLLDKKKAIALHCQGGQGRTGMLAAQLLIERGYNFEQAKLAVKAVKPGALTIQKQTDYLQALVENK